MRWLLLAILSALVLSCSDSTSPGSTDSSAIGLDAAPGGDGQQVTTPDEDIKNDPPDDGLAPDSGLPTGDVLDSEVDETDATPCDGCFGDPCEDPDLCHSGYCTEGPDGPICTKTCGECPQGFSCKEVQTNSGDPVYICVYDHLPWCRPCLADSDCAHPLGGNYDNRCLDRGDGSGSYCATSCTTDDSCPPTSTCATLGADSDVSVCMPPAESDCPCTQRAITEAAETTCQLSNAIGSCDGARVCLTEGLSACDALTPELERCDASDNDCDGQTDEDFPDKGQACDSDADEDQCLDGTWVCADDILVCEDDAISALEICNDLDDDCDGSTDEGFEGKGEACDGNDLDLCSDGVFECQAGGLACSDDEASIVESCNALDDDCDGETDEDFVNLGQACDGDDADDCAEGFWVCNAEGGLECNDGPEVVTESCNGLDDDCDGVIPEDESDGDNDGVRVCAGDCDDIINTTYPGAPERCDGVNNDCDEDTDEDYLPGGSVTYLELDGSGARSLGDGCGLGACANGTVVCGADLFSLVCDKNALATTEVCDGIDNDCDGLTDEDFAVGGSITYTDLDGTEGLALGESCGTGSCADGVVVCQDGGLSCSTLNEVSDDICDDVDNDCDGVTDESYIADGSVTFTDLNGSADLVKGDACGVGACEGGTVVCAADESTLTCSTSNAAGGELCDELDNDCDGSTDEDYLPGGPFTYTDLAGNTDLSKGAACGTGECANGTVVCSAGSLSCNTESVQSDDVCDGLDNDCDGSTDEDFVANGSVTLTDLDGSSGLVKGDSCGVGSCAGGTVVCAANGAALACSSHGAASPESCDLDDNDCDGAVDESLTFSNDLAKLAQVGCKTNGVCGNTNATVASCQNGAWSCDYVSDFYEVDETSCDNRDNDCDGQLDESLTITNLWDAASVGCKSQGVCGLSGVTSATCSNGSWQCAYNHGSYQAFETKCDNLDNDCNGSTDPDGINECVDSWYDGDGDGFGNPDNYRCQCFPSGSWKLNGDDCYGDVNGSVNPDAGWHEGPHSGNNYDWNCDGSATKRWTFVVGSCQTNINLSNLCQPTTGDAQGWKGGAPSCGGQGSWVGFNNCSSCPCNETTWGVCNCIGCGWDNGSNRKQQCR